jgi:4-oxalmesaconate hydratase
VPYHWGRYRGMSLEMMERPLEGLLDNVFFDTCVYHQPGVELLTKVIPAEQRAVRLRDDRRGARQGPGHRPVLRRHQALRRRHRLAERRPDRYKIYEGNARRVYPRLDARLKAQGK